MPSRVLSITARSALVVVMAGCAAAPPAAPATPATGSTLAPVTSAQVATDVPTPVESSPSGAGPVAVWRLDGDGSGSPGDALTFNGGHRFAHGAVVLDGATGYGATGGPGPLDTSSGFTASAWVSPDAVTPFASAVSQVGEVAAAFYLGFGEGSWAFSLKDLDTNEPGHTVRAEATEATSATGAWTHLAGVFDPAAGEIRLYVDGTLAASTPFDAPFRAGGELRIGGAQVDGRPDDGWPGAIGEVALFQEALPDGAIRSLRASTRPDGAPVAWSDDATVPEALRGTWDYVLSDEEVKLLAGQLGPTAADVGIPGAETRIRYGLDGNRWWLGFVFDGTLWLLDGVPEGDGGVMTVQGDEMRQTNGADGWITYRWAIEGDELTLTVDACVPQDGVGECSGIDVVRFMTERTFTRSGSDPSY